MLFLTLGLAWIHYPGIQNDEALFAAPVFQPKWAHYWLEAGPARLPLMLMSYLGTTKAWLYTPIFQICAPTPFSIRFPVLLAGAASIWLFFRFLTRAAGGRAALLGAALLATDSTYLLTVRCDWGPVALQHLFLVAALLLVLKYHQQRAILSLAAAFFLFGLALWDKALFTWVLSGLVLGVLAVFGRELRQHLTLRNLAVAGLAFSMGSAPLLVYNFGGEQRFGTFTGNAVIETSDLPGKARFLAISLRGSSLFGYWAREPHEEPLREPATRLERVSVWLSRVSGQPRSTLFYPCLLAALAIAPLLWRAPERRMLLFTAIVVTVAWIQMAVTRNAGGGIHHTVLLWPFPHLFVAVAFAGVSRRFGPVALWTVTLATVLVCSSNVLLTNNYYAQMIRNGSSITWTDAIYPLSEYLKTAPARQIFVLDWGLFDTLRLLNGGRLDLHVGSEPFTKEAMSDEDRRNARSMVLPENLFLGHTEGNEFDARVPRQLAAWARQEGYRKQLLEVAKDRNGRPVFEVFRMERISESRTSRTPGPARATRPGA